MFLKMLGPERLELTMPWLCGGPYTAEPGAVFEVDDRDGLSLLEGNDRLFEPVSCPALEGQRIVPPATSPAPQKPRRRRKENSEADAAGKDA